MAVLGGYGAIHGDVVYSGGTSGRTFICYSTGSDFIAGQVTDFSVYLNAIGGNIKLKVFRKNGTNFDFVGESQVCSPEAMGVQAFELTTPITVQAGDYIGVWLQNSSVRIEGDSGAGGFVEYISGDITESTAISSFTELSGYFLCMQGEGTVGASVTISTPVQYQTYQRDGSNQADISISGTYVGTPTAVEASFNGGDYATIDGSPSGGTFSGTLTDQSTGQGTLTVRFTNDTDVNDSVSDIGIGDVFVVVGDSLSEGRLSSAQSYSGSYKATMYREDDTWAELHDPTDSDTGLGSIWPLLATKIMADQSCTVAFITCGEGGSDLYDSDEWVKGNSGYTNMDSQISSSDVNAVKAFLAHLGANASYASTAPTEAGYNSLLDDFADNLYGDYGARLVLMQMGECTTGSPPDRRTANDNIRSAVNLAWSDNSNVITGPCHYDIVTDDGVHIKTNEKAAISAQRWWLAIKEAFYGGSSKSGRGPKVTYVYREDDKVYVIFDKALDSDSGTGGWRVTDDGTPVEISSASYYSTYIIQISLSSTPSGTVEVLLGSENDGSGANVPTDTTDDSLPSPAFRTTDINDSPPPAEREVSYFYKSLEGDQ